MLEVMKVPIKLYKNCPGFTNKCCQRVVILGCNENRNPIHLSSFWAPVQGQQLHLGDTTDFEGQYITIFFYIKQF